MSTDASHVCKPGATVYYCPTSNDTESDCHGGFDHCCDRPDQHIAVSNVLRESMADAIRERIKWATIPSGQRPDGLAMLLAPTERDLADVALAALLQYLNIGEEEAWCKTCRRVWEGKDHQCEGQAEERLAEVLTVLDDVLRHFVHKGHPGEPCLSSGWASEKTVARWRSILYQEQPPAHDAGPSVAECAAVDRNWDVQKEGE